MHWVKENIDESSRYHLAGEQQELFAHTGMDYQANSPPSCSLLSLPSKERPQSRLERMGAQALSAAELLSILIGGPDALDTAFRLMADCNGIGRLFTMTEAELQQTFGIDLASAQRIPVALELARRLLTIDFQEQPRIRSPNDVAVMLMPDMVLLEQEVMRVLMLDTKNVVRSVRELYKGSLNMITVRIGEVFRFAIRDNSAAVILVHNHPSGDPTPSPEDVRVTEAIVCAGQLLDIEVLDHIVIGRNRFTSMKERGLGFK